MFKNKTKKFNFRKTRPETDDSANQLVPAIKLIPTWYKKAPHTIDPTKIYYNYDGSVEKFPNHINPETQIGATFKRCVPILDAMIFGYMIVLGQDVIFDEDTLSFNLDSPVQQITHSPYEAEGYIFPSDAHQKLFKWDTGVKLELPEGYSALFMTPMHRNDLPFYTLSGVVDVDRHPLTVNTPMIMKKGFSGVIPKGTPVVQVIPLKREDWKLNELKHQQDTQDTINNFFELISGVVPKTGVYKRKVREPKNFS